MRWWGWLVIIVFAPSLLSVGYMLGWLRGHKVASTSECITALRQEIHTALMRDVDTSRPAACRDVNKTVLRRLIEEVLNETTHA